MKAVRNESWKEPKNGYTGQWYERQAKPQPIFLRFGDDDNSSEFDTEVLGGGYSPDEWHNRHLRIYFPKCAVITCDEEDQFLFENKELIQSIYDSYEETRNSNGESQGGWNRDLVEKLEKIAEEFQSEFSFWDDEE